MYQTEEVELSELFSALYSCRKGLKTKSIFKLLGYRVKISNKSLFRRKKLSGESMSWNDWMSCVNEVSCFSICQGLACYTAVVFYYMEKQEHIYFYWHNFVFSTGQHSDLLVQEITQWNGFLKKKKKPHLFISWMWAFKSAFAFHISLLSVTPIRRS